MSDRYHINPETGRSNKCYAEQQCRFGLSREEHYGSAAEARGAYEMSMASETIPTSSKKVAEMKTVKRVKKDPVSQFKDRILASNDPENTTRDVLQDHRDDLDYDAAMAVSQTPFQDDFNGMEDETRDVIFGTAYDEVYGDDYTVEGTENWNAVYNEYSDYMKMVRAVRESSYVDSEHEMSPIAESVSKSSNRRVAAARAFSSNPNMELDEAREVIEACYPVAVSTLDQKARTAIFDHAYSRESSEGWLQVAERYSTNAEIASRVKLSREDRAVARAKGEIRDLRQSLVSRVEGLDNRRLEAEIESVNGEIEFAGGHADPRNAAKLEVLEAERNRRVELFKSGSI